MKMCGPRIFLKVLFFFFLCVEANAEESWNLQRCVDYAVQNNPDLQAAEAKIKVSTYSFDYQKKLFLPRLDLNGSTGYLTGEPTSPFAVIGGVTEEGLRSKNVSGEYVSGALTLSVPVFKEGVLFAKNAPTINMASNQVLIDKKNYEAKKNEIVFDVSTAFFNLLKINENIKAAGEHIKSLEETYKLAGSKYKEGLISKNELLKTEVGLASGEKELSSSRNLSQLYSSDLSFKMGLESTKHITISPEDFKLPNLPPADKLVSIALANRPEVGSQEMRVSLAKEDQRKAESERYPNVDFNSSYGLINDYGSRVNQMWTSALVLNMPIFDFGAVRSKIKSQEAKSAEEEKLLHAIKGSVALEVIKAITSIDNARSEITLREKTVEQTTENARLMRAQFEQNLIPLSSVLEAEYALYEEQKALAQAKYDLTAGYLQMVKATGSSLVLLSQQ
jgi:outer membrane protein TolC